MSNANFVAGAIAGAAAVAVATLAVNPGASRASERPVNPDKVDRCDPTDVCTVSIRMSLDATTKACRFDVAGAVLVPRAVRRIAFEISSDDPQREFAFDHAATRQPLFIKSFSSASAWSFAASAPASYTVSRQTRELSAVHYGVRARYREGPDGEWKPCPAELDPIVVNIE